MRDAPRTCAIYSGVGNAIEMTFEAIEYSYAKVRLVCDVLLNVALVCRLSCGMRRRSPTMPITRGVRV
jgi:hypothetical protein